MVGCGSHSAAVIVFDGTTELQILNFNSKTFVLKLESSQNDINKYTFKFQNNGINLVGFEEIKNVKDVELIPSGDVIKLIIELDPTQKKKYVEWSIKLLYQIDENYTDTDLFLNIINIEQEYSNNRKKNWETEERLYLV
jgi:hypothetical protein